MNMAVPTYHNFFSSTFLLMNSFGILTRIVLNFRLVWMSSF
ncbi:unnamed protein product [Brassica oleracea var. botrytis]